MRLIFILDLIFLRVSQFANVNMPFEWQAATCNTVSVPGHDSRETSDQTQWWLSELLRHQPVVSIFHCMSVRHSVRSRLQRLIKIKFPLNENSTEFLTVKLKSNNQFKTEMYLRWKVLKQQKCCASKPKINLFLFRSHYVSGFEIII